MFETNISLHHWKRLCSVSGYICNQRSEVNETYSQKNGCYGRGLLFCAFFFLADNIS